MRITFAAFKNSGDVKNFLRIPMTLDPKVSGRKREEDEEEDGEKGGSSFDHPAAYLKRDSRIPK